MRSATAQSALVVLCTAADSPGGVRGLLAVLPQLTRRHRVLVASVIDPDVAAARTASGRIDDVYLAAAAHLGVDAHALHVALDASVREHLQELGELRPRID